MPFRVHNSKTQAVYTAGIVSEPDEVDITSDQTPAVDGGGKYLPAAYGDEAKAEVSASTATKKKSGGAN